MNKQRLLLVLISVIAFLTDSLPNTQAIILPTIPSGTYNILNYGASTNLADNTKAIQSAIDACTASGGGTVVIPNGTFLSGPLNLKSNVNLKISSGSVLKMLPYGSGNGTPSGSYPNNGTADNYYPLISANKVNNIKVSGSGSIDGQGSNWWSAYRACKCIGRPGVIRFDNCNYTQIDSITIINAPNVHITVGKNCTNSTISNVVINSPSDSPNTDGIDTWSPYINVLNCSISCGDDNIAMDSNSKYITIKKCMFGSGHGCSIGSYASNISNILVDSCTFEGTGNGARFKTSRDRGGVEEYITYSNCTMNNVSNPFYLSSYYPKEPARPDTASSAAITANTPTWRHILFKNIVVTGATYAGTIWGLPELSISDVVFDNVTINAPTAMKLYNAKDIVFKNGSSVTIPTTAKVNGKVIDLYNANVTGINLFTGQAIAETTQTIILTSSEDIADAINTRYDGTSINLVVILPSGYANPNGTSALDLTGISSVIKNLTIKGSNNEVVLKTLQINPPVSSSLNSLTLKCLSIKGVDDGASVASSYLFYPNTTGISIGSFNIDSCLIKNYYGLLRIGNIGTSGSIANINVSNSIISNLGGYGFITLGLSSCYYAGNVSIKNCTFTNIEASVFYAKYSNSTSVTISNCTFDKILNTSSSNLFCGNSTSIVNFQNCILGKTLNSASTGIVSNIMVVQNSYKTTDWLNTTNTTTQFTAYENTSTTLFKSPSIFNTTTPTSSTTGNYTIADPAFAGKTSAGDPRWYYQTNTDASNPAIKNIRFMRTDNELRFSEKCNVTIISLTGQIVKRAFDTTVIRINEMPQNVYILKIDCSQNTLLKKIVL